MSVTFVAVILYFIICTTTVVHMNNNSINQSFIVAAHNVVHDHNRHDDHYNEQQYTNYDTSYQYGKDSNNKITSEKSTLKNINNYHHHDHDHRHLNSIFGTSHSERKCGVREPNDHDYQLVQSVVSKYMMKKKNLNGLQSNQISESPIVVDTYFHVITDAFGNGELSNNTLFQQLKVLNDSFQLYGLTFRLLNITYTTNETWYTADVSTTDDFSMKSSLRIGNESTLNVYFKRPRSFGREIYGYATFPMDYENRPSDDGVVVSSITVPGGNSSQYNEGKTLVHEVGHWLGLFHTFNTDFGFFPLANILLSIVGIRNGCNTRGDGIIDTPRQRSPTRGCPVGRDSCPLRPGLDPISNYMDYSDDVCYTEFTPSQTDRMKAMWDEYRRVVIVG